MARTQESIYERFRRAVEVFGCGFLAHPANSALRAKLTVGALTPRCYCEQLVVLACRLVLAITAEEHGQTLVLVRAEPFSEDALPDLAESALPGEAMIQAIHCLGMPTATELGAVHEELLTLDPVVNVARGEFALSAAGGEQRKRTGSYYTSSAFIDSLLESALDPVIDEALKRAGPSVKDRQRALLNLRICDPACGAGYFLVAAARRLACRLTAVRAGEQGRRSRFQPAALADVIGRCIYGVDISPAAVELCKLTLRLELLAAGAPLTPALDGRIVCGNALIGVAPGCSMDDMPDLLKEGFEFFDWSEAFPEVFRPLGAFRAGQPGLQEGGRDARPPGFDVVIGNPPYRAAMTQRERQIARRLYPLAAPASNSAADFTELCARIVRPGRCVGLVLPKSLTYSYAWRALRVALAPAIVSAVDIRRGWDDVLLEQILLTFRPGEWTSADPRGPASAHSGGRASRPPRTRETRPAGSIARQRHSPSIQVGVFHHLAVDYHRLDAGLIERLGIIPTGLGADDLKLLECVLDHSDGTLSRVCTTQRGTSLQALLRPDGDVPVVAGKDIAEFGPLRPRGSVRNDEVSPARLRWTEPPQAVFQNIIAHVTRPVDHLQLIGTVANEHVACLDTVNLLTIHDSVISPAGLCAFLMSDLIGWFVYACVYNKAVRTMHFDGYFLVKIPLPRTQSFSALEQAAAVLAGDPRRSESWRALNVAIFDLFETPIRLRRVTPSRKK